MWSRFSRRCVLTNPEETRLHLYTNDDKTILGIVGPSTVFSEDDLKLLARYNIESTPMGYVIRPPPGKLKIVNLGPELKSDVIAIIGGALILRVVVEPSSHDKIKLFIGEGHEGTSADLPSQIPLPNSNPPA